MMSNAAGLYDQLQQDLPTAISRAFDYAAIHGLDLKSGGAGPFGDYLAATPNSQVIGSTAAASGGVYTDLWKGVQQVVNAPQQGYEFSGFAADPRLRPEAAMSTDANGRSFFLENSFQANNGISTASLIGYPTFFNTGVSGKYYRQGDGVQTVTLVGSPTGGTFTVTVGGQTTAGIAYNASGATVTTAVQLLTGTEAANLVVTGSAGGPYTFTFSGPASPVSINQKSLTGGTAAASLATVVQSPNLDSGLRAIGGDWSQCAYGVGMDITIKVSTEANYYDGSTWHSAFQDSAVALCQTIVTPLPTGASAVVLDVAARAWANPTNANAEGAAPFSVNWGAVSGGLWLTKQNKAALRRLAGLGGAFTFDPTPTDAGTGLQPWDQNTTWLNGVPLAEDYSPDVA
jgi:hypothetical protein